jgi:hypothetical protein
MATQTWGAPQTRAAPPPGRARRAPPATAAGHRGLVRLHLAAIALWLVAAAVLGLAAATGWDVPAGAFVAGALAAAGHAGFLALHGALGAAVQRRGAPPGRARGAEPGPAPRGTGRGGRAEPTTRSREG